MRLLSALVRWERQPGSEVTAREMEDAAREAAKHYGTTATALRAAIATNRRAGMLPEDAVTAAICSTRQDRDR